MLYPYISTFLTFLTFGQNQNSLINKIFMTIPYTKFGNTGLTVSKLVLGTLLNIVSVTHSARNS